MQTFLGWGPLKARQPPSEEWAETSSIIPEKRWNEILCTFKNWLGGAACPLVVWIPGEGKEGDRCSKSTQGGTY